MSKYMISKFPGTCRDCGRAVARGESIIYHGRGAGISCTACEGDTYSQNHEGEEDELSGLERGTLANDRRMARAGLSVARTSSGWSGTRNSLGRCEDAPCCGCCTY